MVSLIEFEMLDTFVSLSEHSDFVLEHNLLFTSASLVGMEHLWTLSLRNVENTSEQVWHHLHLCTFFSSKYWFTIYTGMTSLAYMRILPLSWGKLSVAFNTNIARMVLHSSSCFVLLSTLWTIIYISIWYMCSLVS